MINREYIQKFLFMERNAVAEVFKKKFSATASSLLNVTEELFRGQFLKFDNGEMIVKFKISSALPRKGEHLHLMYISKEYQNPSCWENMSYRQLLKYRLKDSHAICIWLSKTIDKEFALAGFRGIDVDFGEFLSDVPGAIVFFGPLPPPVEYLENLYQLTLDNSSSKIKSILDHPYNLSCKAAPIPIKEKKTSDFVMGQLKTSPITIIQGPPGTGKTHLIADVCEELCKQGKSVLVTALTNRALIEVADKPSLSSLLAHRMVAKSNLTLDEINEIPSLLPIKNIRPISGGIVLSTYYVVSGYAANSISEDIFDVVIMDEASQALLPMFAATFKLGKSNLWVGDTSQLSPVVTLNEDKIKSYEFNGYINGLITLTSKRMLPCYQLTNSYRFSQRSADFTGIFYSENLKAINSSILPSIPSLQNILHKDGGPTLVMTDMELGNIIPPYAIDLITYITSQLVSHNSNLEIAILSCFRKSTRVLQKAISLRLGLNNRVLIDTVARVQGLTTDITIFFIPNASLIRSLEPRLFNVATSRAKYHTIIVADKNILNFNYINNDVRTYLTKLSMDKSQYIPISKSLIS